MSITNYVNGEILDQIYSSVNPQIVQKIYPPSIRVDEVKPNMAAERTNTYLFQQGRNYMLLQRKDTEVYKLELYNFYQAGTQGSADNVAGAGNYWVSSPTGDVPSPPGMIGPWNFDVDNLCLSKALTNIQMNFAGSELNSQLGGINSRNPFLQELKTLFFDWDIAESFDIHPLLHSNYGSVLKIGSKGIIPRQETAFFTPQLFNQMNEFVFEDMIIGNDLIKKWRHNGKGNKRWEILDENNKYDAAYAPKFRDITNSVDLDTNYNETFGYFGTTPGSLGQYENIPDNAIIRATIYIRVKEYITESFLQTPYQNKAAQVVPIKPGIGVQFRNDYNTDYINNGLVKWICPRGGKFVPNGSSVTNGDYSLTIERQPELSTIQVVTFDLSSPPPPGTGLRLVTYEPIRLDADKAYQEINVIRSGQGAKGNKSQKFTVRDAASTSLGNYYVIAADPRFWSGLQNNVFANNASGVHTVSTFNLGEIGDVKMWVDQTELTENLVDEILRNMTVEILNAHPKKNKKLLDIIHNRDTYLKGHSDGVEIKKRGFPLIIIDPARLNTQVSNLIQYMPNVKYNYALNVVIEFTVTSPDLNLDTPNNTVNVKFYPEVYKFLPYLYYQNGSLPITKEPIINRAPLAEEALKTPKISDNTKNLDMIYGGGLFDDVKDLARIYGKDLMKAVRLGEKATRGNPNLKGVNAGLNVASNVGSMFGYGN